MNIEKTNLPNLSDLESKLGYVFKTPELLTQAITHKSANGFVAGANTNYQRLEFVGDAALGLFIAEELYRRYPKADEGFLTQWRANIVNRDYLAKLAQNLSLNQFLITASNQTKVRDNVNVLSDVMEAIIAAIYFDGGWSAVHQTLTQLLDSALNNIHSISELKDSKSQLQEYLQQRKWPLPDYENVIQTGPKHQPTFVVQIKIPSFHSRREKQVYTNFGEGETRKEAERQAAGKALMYLQSYDIILDETS